MEAISGCSAANLSSFRKVVEDVSLSPLRKSQQFLSQSSHVTIPRKQLMDSSIRKPLRCYAVSSSVPSHSFDVVIIGAGIIGLTIARQFLLETDLSVAVVDKAVPCSGATGAGQGYIWMTHKTPGSDIWELAMRSHKLWEELAEQVKDDGMNPSQVLGWRRTGSLLVGQTPEEIDTLKSRVDKLSQAGLKAEYLSSNELQIKEPALAVGNGSGAAFLHDDCQLDAHLTVSYIEKVNRRFSADSRYAEFYYNPVTNLTRSASTGDIVAVHTSEITLYSNKAVIVAAGCWSGCLMHTLMKNLDIELGIPVKPRKGHLLVIENFNAFQLNHGLMEAGYVDHRARNQTMASSTLGKIDQGEGLSISMTATMDTIGNLVLGSSRQFSGFNTEEDETIINYIWDRGGDFFPALREMNLMNLRRSKKVRVGLRPYMPDGKPIIGPVPGLPNLFLATGHEGGGLSMALGTAELVTDMVLGNPSSIDCSPFSAQNRF
ncbi:unnamed protein product [Rhodiola kirilowii]